MDILADPEFRAGHLDTGFLEGFFARRPKPVPDAEMEAVAAIAAALSQPRPGAAPEAAETSRWKLQAFEGLYR